MQILIFHPVQLPPKDYGGVERVVLWLAKGLKERGHQVTVAALAGSRLPSGCNLLEVKQQYYDKASLLKILPKKIDIAHFMAPLEEETWNHLPFPAVLTVHGNGKENEIFPKNTIFLSKNHAERHNAKCYIYNGIDPADYMYSPANDLEKEDWFLFLSKTSWRVKNLVGAMKYCSKAGVPLYIAGGQRPWLRRIQAFFNPRQRWIGAVSGIRKAQLLSQARALIFPVIWPEPFGLVVAEALMSGTPVIASPQGSLPELVPAEVGCLPKTDEEWIQILQSGLNQFNSENCRKWALKKFHYQRMAEEYEQTYRLVVAGNTLHDNNPISGNWRLK